MSTQLLRLKDIILISIERNEGLNLSAAQLLVQNLDQIDNKEKIRKLASPLDFPHKGELHRTKACPSDNVVIYRYNQP